MPVDLDERRTQLHDLRSRVLGAAHDIVEGDVDDGELSSAAGDQHLADHASEMVDRELDESLEDNAEQLVGEIDRALTKIDAGTYGKCERCGQAIPEERLDAVPYATLCVSCRQLEERE
ncbi:MAG TPA: TraR/DksA C4-type zinc finger protein [Gaiella sp.]|jgi:DnaK suppressor protein